MNDCFRGIVTDLNLECCECKSNFTSASKLLQHFADHAIKNVKIKLKNDILSNARRKRRENNQVSVVVHPESSGSESSPSRQESTLSAMSDSCSESSSHDQPQSCKLAKFDLQKRLESCVSSLGNKQYSDSNYFGEPNIKQEVEENISTDSSVNSPDTKGTEEYSPLKFCMITMDEESNSKTGGNNGPKKGASRKQLLPKKIERKVDGFRKLAPKPEGTVVSPESLLQSPGKKKYACHLCTKVFGWSTDLKRHILVHTGERPFKCKTCQATFTRNFLLQKHQSKVHPCKPRELPLKPEVVEMPNTIVTNSDDDEKVDPLKEEPFYNDDEDDEDEDKLVITEDVDEKSPNSPLSNCSPDSKWCLMPPSSDRRCSDLKQSEIFGITPIKVLTM